MTADTSAGAVHTHAAHGWTSKKIAVVGSKGFIGSRLVNSLRDTGHEVVELDLPRVDIANMTPDDPIINEALAGTDVLFHLAVMNLEHCKRDYRGAIMTNILGAASVMELARRVGVKRVIYSSASSVYGDPIITPVVEHTLFRPLTLYGATKLSAEYVMGTYADNFGLTLGVFRFTNVYGPGQVNGLIPNVVRALLGGMRISVTGSGEQMRDFVYVDDVVNVLMRSIEHPLYSFVTNLGSGQQTSVNEVIKWLSEYTGKEAQVEHIPLTKDRLAFAADLRLFKEIYGDCKFTPVSEGLQKTVEWWKSRGC